MKSFYSNMWYIIKVSEINWRNPTRCKETELKRPFSNVNEAKAGQESSTGDSSSFSESRAACCFHTRASRASKRLNPWRIHWWRLQSRFPWIPSTDWDNSSECWRFFEELCCCCCCFTHSTERGRNRKSLVTSYQLICCCLCGVCRSFSLTDLRENE